MKKILSKINNVKSEVETEDVSTITSILPKELTSNSEALQAFFKEYVSFLNQEGYPTQSITSLISSRDIDKADDRFVDLLISEIGSSLPTQLESDRIQFYKKIVDFYKMKGSLDSIKIFFKVFYGDDVDVYYPRDFMFMFDEGLWDPNIQIPIYDGNNLIGYEQGAHTDIKGGFDDQYFLQDDYFYQTYSYVIKTSKNVDDWRYFFNDTIHPSGFIFFGEINVNIILEGESDFTIPDISPGFVEPDEIPKEIYIEASFEVEQPDESQIYVTRYAFSEFTLDNSEFIHDEHYVNKTYNEQPAEMYLDKTVVDIETEWNYDLGVQQVATGSYIDEGDVAIIAMIGSNNASGSAVGTSFNSNPNVRQWISSTKVLREALNPLDNITVNPNTVGFGVDLGKLYHDSKGKEVVLVPCGKNETSISDGYWDIGGVGYTEALARINDSVSAIISEGKTISEIVYIISLGESDVNLRSFSNKLDNLIVSLRMNTNQALSSSPALVIEYSDEWINEEGVIGYDYKAIQARSNQEEILRDVRNRISHTAAINTNSLITNNQAFLEDNTEGKFGDIISFSKNSVQQVLPQRILESINDTRLNMTANGSLNPPLGYLYPKTVKDGNNIKCTFDSNPWKQPDPLSVTWKIYKSLIDVDFKNYGLSKIEVGTVRQNITANNLSDHLKEIDSSLDTSDGIDIHSEAFAFFLFEQIPSIETIDQSYTFIDDNFNDLSVNTSNKYDVIDVYSKLQTTECYGLGSVDLEIKYPLPSGDNHFYFVVLEGTNVNGTNGILSGTIYLELDGSSELDARLDAQLS